VRDEQGYLVLTQEIASPPSLSKTMKEIGEL